MPGMSHYMPFFSHAHAPKQTTHKLNVQANQARFPLYLNKPSTALFSESNFLTKFICALHKMFKEGIFAHMGLVARKPVFGGFANNTGADQPAHPQSLISAFVIHVLESVISSLATGKISIF